MSARWIDTSVEQRERAENAIEGPGAAREGHQMRKGNLHATELGFYDTERSAVERPQMAADGRSTETKGHGKKTAAQREQAILALLSERSLSSAAARCNVGERTLRRWITEDSAFKAAYDAARTATFRAGMDRAQALVGRAIDTLEDLLDAKDSPSVRLGAARTVAEIGMHQYEAETILQRLNEIEAAHSRRRR